MHVRLICAIKFYLLTYLSVSHHSVLVVRQHWAVCRRLESYITERPRNTARGHGVNDDKAV